MVQQLVAYGALRGEVLDPGTGPGHHAIYFASKGYATTGVDRSSAAIDRARRNARCAEVTVDFGSGCDRSRRLRKSVRHRGRQRLLSRLPGRQTFKGNTCGRCIGPPNPGRGCSCRVRAPQRQRRSFRGLTGGQFRARAAIVGLAHRLPRNHDVSGQYQSRDPREHVAGEPQRRHCRSDEAAEGPASRYRAVAGKSSGSTCRSGL